MKIFTQIPSYTVPESIYNYFINALPIKQAEDIFSDVDTILSKSMYDNVRISSTIRKQKYGAKYYYKDLYHHFENIYDINKSYSSEAHKCRSYRLKSKYLSDDLITNKYTNKIVINRVNRTNEIGLEYYIAKQKAINEVGINKRFFDKTLTSIDKKVIPHMDKGYMLNNKFDNIDLFKHLLSITCDVNYLKEIKQSKKALNNQLKLSKNRKDKDSIIKLLRKLQYSEFITNKWLNKDEDSFLFKQNDSIYRIFTLLTSTTKEMRQHKLIYPCKVVELDHSASHISELTSYIRKVIPHMDKEYIFNLKDLFIETHKLDEIHLNNDIYTYFNLKDVSRDDLKQYFFKYFLYATATTFKRSKLAQRIRKEFPEIYKFMLQDKQKNGNSHLSVVLQIFEALKNISIQRHFSKICFTAGVHDSIIIDCNFINDLQNKLKDIYTKYDCALKYKIKEIN